MTTMTTKEMQEWSEFHAWMDVLIVQLWLRWLSEIGKANQDVNL